MVHGVERYEVLVAREDERRRLADELHDGVQQLVYSAMQYTAVARQSATRDPERLVATLSSAYEVLEELLGELRRTVVGLRPAVLEEQGLLGALHHLAATVQDATGLSVRVMAEVGPGDLPAPVELAAYRIAQEALANVQKHASARQVHIRVVWNASVLKVDVVDDGAGMTRRRGHSAMHQFGLHSMEQRAALVGGWLQVNSVGEGRGTRVRLRVPLASRSSVASVRRAG